MRYNNVKVVLNYINPVIITFKKTWSKNYFHKRFLHQIQDKKLLNSTFYILLKYIKYQLLDRPLKNHERVLCPVCMDAWHYVGATIPQIVNWMAGFSLVFSTTGKGPFQTSNAHLQLQAASHSQLRHFLKHTVHRVYQKFSIEKFIMWTMYL